MLEQSPHIQLATMSRLYVVSRGIHTVARLGLANYMSTEPKPVNQLAKATNTQPELLERLLNFLSSYKIFLKDNQSYALTDLSKPLRDDDPHSIREVLCMVDDSWWQAFSSLELTLKTGKSAFSHEHGDDFFDFLGKHHDKQINYDQGMAKLSTYDNDKIATAYDFSRFKIIVDLGGGRGGLAKALVKHHPQLRVILFDTPSVIQKLNPADFPSQIILEQGDFLKSIPQGDAYFFKGVLHDFNDELTTKILKNCHSQLPKHAELFIAEQALPESTEPHPNKTMDIVMMVLLAGRQRTVAEWKMCLQEAGFTFCDAHETETVFTLMRGKVQ